MVSVHRHRRSFTAWIDVENPPQVQYLLPFRQAFQAAGINTVITARDYGSTVSMLKSAGVEANVFGTRVGRGRLRKAASSARRAHGMRNFLARTGRPDALLTASRAAAVVAWRLGIPSFVIVDYDWKHEPITLHRAVPFVALLKSVDAVICSGGTMLREAAYLGIPAYSIFQSEIGAVDRWLEAIGRAKLIAGPDDLASIQLKHRGPLRRLDSNPDLLDQIAAVVSAGAVERPRETAGVA